ncbi:MAG: lipid-A-disaccharide synthase [Saprospiraceae bacterium]|jgi:lipid-A-disaccharide synthase|nr:lipid-A-disaccharide synthase [Saprospiraceae bacterium]
MKFFLIAGEVSGDKHGGIMIKAIKNACPAAEFQIIGGTSMENAAGVSSIISIRQMAFMGFIQVIFKLTSILKWIKITQSAITAFQPDVVVLIDYPGFNLRIAKWAKSQNFKVAYYISPKVWAWNKSRVYDIKKYVDQMFCILPFEKAFYAKYDYEVSYFGNPLLDEIFTFQKDPDFLFKHGFDKPILALLPGSRIQEINRILPSMLEAAKHFPQYHWVIPRSPNLDIHLILPLIPTEMVSRVMILENDYFNLLSYARLALVTSGTATLETALFKVPQVVCYKTGALTYFLAKQLVELKFISLVNLIADKEVVKELIQNNCNPKSLVEELTLLASLSEEAYIHFYDGLMKEMGKAGSAKRVAEALVAMA